ncbi:toxin-antitoxin system YwqK family antitoxin [uncultured Aquimarina sp.]|uniref:toxin-antitoxin system YwqK family antitoxin n=1 Tax=uncultured Aquimarina sp. TaxID=575652 RepID=UPI002609C2E6|nr:hypothetical protein [uncultured Aquimarina sp.]
MRTAFLKYTFIVTIIFISKTQSQELVLSSTTNTSNISENIGTNGNTKKTLHYSNGTIKEIRETKNDVLHGLWKFFFSNGELKKEGAFSQGKSIGTWKIYNKKGQLIFIENYKNGNEHGTWKAFFPNGNVKIEGEFVSGKRQGPWKVYTENGVLKKLITFEDDIEKGEIELNDPSKDLNFFSVQQSIGNY